MGLYFRYPVTKRILILTLFAIMVFGGLYYWQAKPSYTSEDLYLPAPDTSHRQLRLRLLLPRDKTGPFPLVIINHGSPASRQGRKSLNDLHFTTLSQWFLKQGYAVAMPLRRGYGTHGGKWNEGYESCRIPHYYRAGLETAKDIIAAHQFVTGTRTDIIADQTLIVGQSAGGWGALAMASLNPDGIIGIINFAGGRGGIEQNRLLNNCNADELIWAAKLYGQTASIPSLWLYAENDSFFPPDLVKKMFNAFQSSQNHRHASLIITAPVGDDGHRLAIDKNAKGQWTRHVKDFIDELSTRNSAN